MSDETTISIPDSFNSENGGTIYSGGRPSEQPQAQVGGEVHAPELSQTQQQSQAIVTELRAKAAGGTLTPRERVRLNEHWRHAQGVDHAVPLELRVNPAPDHREHDSMARALEAEHAPATKQEVEQLGAKMAVQGAGEWRGAVENMAQELQLDPAAAKTFATRWTRHALGGQMEGGNFQPLTAEEATELASEAARICGGYDKLKMYAEGAEEYIKTVAPEIYAKLEKHGALNSSIALDPWLLSTLYHANQRRLAKGAK